MNKQEYEDVLSEFGPDVANGELTGNQAEATVLLNLLGDACPSAFRSPLRAVREGTEIPGTAEDVLQAVRGLVLND